MILGSDQLGTHSPMWIHWRKKLIKFTYHKKRIMLRGISNVVTQYSQITYKLKGLLKKKVVHQILELKAICPLDHKEVDVTVDVSSTSVLTGDQNESQVNDQPAAVGQTLLQQFDQLFQEPTSLPPSRAYDHHIPLVTGAQPVNVRPYRYAPMQKTKIEKQVQEMLASGIIQHSVGPFASPVLLVKKDRTWRFCVDYSSSTLSQ